MRLRVLCLSLLLTSSAYGQQTTFTNQSVVKMIQMGFDENTIIEAINRNATNFDMSLDSLIALKTAGVTNNEVAAMMRKSSSRPEVPTATPIAGSTQTAAPTPAIISTPAATSTMTPAPMSTTVLGQHAGKPRVYLASVSKGNVWSAGRDQSIEMSKDFETSCPGVRISVNQQVADYTVQLNHIEHGFGRDNQIQVTNRDGDLIKTKDGGSIKSGVKKACEDILQDWSSERR